MKNFLWVIRAVLRAALWRVPGPTARFRLHASFFSSRWPWRPKPPASISSVDRRNLSASMASTRSSPRWRSCRGDLAVRFERSRDCRCSACLSHRAAPMDCVRCQPFFVRVPQPDAGNLDKLGKIIFAWLVVFVWWIGAVVAILRGAGIGPYQSPVFRAFWLSVVAGLAIIALPAYPTFIGGDFRLSSYNRLGMEPRKVLQTDRSRYVSSRYGGCRAVAATSSRSRIE